MAKRHFTERGFKGTTLDAVAEEARCAKGALYLEFADKETLLRAVVEETFAAIRSSFTAEVMAIASPLARLGETLRFAYRQYAREPLFGRLLREDPELKALGLGSQEDDGRAARAQIEQLAGWVDEGVALGEIRPDVDRYVVPFAIGVLRTAPQQLALTSGLVAVSQERVLEGLVQLFLAGLAAPPKPAPRRAASKKKTTRKQVRRQS
ncbi:transcriptional regulator, TetR family [Nannocystis exedens]|uniref:Transcriptional regulator, TetR family n=1 Tax=Nannocystis exedens TaxID=54 RepID=A0A1I1XH13_9BACT|nr:TetR/AcrR family transcriptional regulator [Nannocystis exedens]PCC73414.1 HTH-type transcriptional repressor KstR2 [Nannocystis exedens]SFE06646.1 transcriptional regulator, TetR family [Nannocystis exedens]